MSKNIPNRPPELTMTNIYYVPSSCLLQACEKEKLAVDAFHYALHGVYKNGTFILHFVCSFTLYKMKGYAENLLSKTLLNT